MKFNDRSMLLVFTVMLLILGACRKKDLEGPDRLFRPVLKGALESEANWVKANWQAIKGATGYTVELSRDTFRTILQSKNVDTNYVLFENLNWNQLYQVQVRANASDTAKNSYISNLGSIKTPKFPSILNPVTLADVTDEAVRISWITSGAAVTNVKILKASDSSVVADISLSATDISNGFKVVSGLSGGTAYIAYLYSGTSVRGWENFTTRAPLTGSIIDLRSITGRPSVLADTIPQVASGSTIILKRGEAYTISSTLALSKSLKIVSGADLTVPTQATINLPSNFNILAGSNIDYIDFEDVYLRGTDYAAKYVFNISAACNIGRISFESCRAEIFRGMVRLQTAVINVTNFSINNCIIDSVSNYGVVNVDNVNCKIDNISIKKSTIYKTEKVVTSKQNSLTVTIDECTFNESPWANSTSSFIVDYNALNVTNGVSIKNNIFGVGKPNPAAPTLPPSVREIRVGAATVVESINNYKTSDHTTLASPLANLIAYPNPSTTLWQDPLNGNFRIVDISFAGKSTAGDPRWR